MAQKAVLDSNLERLLQTLANYQSTLSGNLRSGGAIGHMRPSMGAWNGDIKTEAGLSGIHRAFNTDMAEAALIEAYNVKNPGNVSDGIVLSLQIDYAAQAERAYRARVSQGFPRMIAHTTARARGHGQANGALLGQALGYFTSVIQQGSGGES